MKRSFWVVSTYEEEGKSILVQYILHNLSILHFPNSILIVLQAVKEYQIIMNKQAGQKWGVSGHIEDIVFIQAPHTKTVIDHHSTALFPKFLRGSW